MTSPSRGHFSGACALAVSLCVSAAATGDTLDDAYARELTMLRAERDALRTELERVRREGDSRVAELSATLDEQTDELARLRGVAADFEREIRAVNERRSARGAQAELVVATAEHARDLLRDHGVAPTLGDTTVAATLDTLFVRGIALVARLGQVRVDSGSFFTAGGVETEGTVVRLGAVAALGAARGSGGPLAPVGDEWRVARSDGGAAARALAERTRAGRVPVLLTDPNEPSSAGAGRRGLIARVRDGGPIVWPILLLGLVAAAIVIERVLVLGRVESGTARVGEAVRQAVRTSDFGTAERVCTERPGAVARVLESLLGRRGQSRERLDDALSEAIMNEMPRLQRFLPTLRVIAAVTPLLGLLGTVTGMISTFDVITEFGTGDPRLLSGGISEALVTTELGLAVAIPSLLLHSLLSGRVERVVDHMETRGLELMLALHDAERPS